MHTTNTRSPSRQAFFSQISLSCALALASACGQAVTTDAGDAAAMSEAAAEASAEAGAETGAEAGPVDSGLDAGALEAGGADATPGDARPMNPCTPQARNGEACPREGVVCEYGNDPRPGCRETARCNASLHWELSAPPCSALSPPEMCPATREAAAGNDCAAMGTICGYAGHLCECTNCRSYPVSGCGGPTRWRCTAPSADTACPAARPNLGTSCPTEGQRCAYDCEAYGPQGSAVCSNGIWAPAPSNCPMSTRRVKRDIEYVTDAQREQLARETLSVRLATYEYTDPALRGPRRLGFILEDQPAYSYARSPESSAVDLYGYASMLVATVQSQQRQIDELRREVAGLRARRAR